MRRTVAAMLGTFVVLLVAVACGVTEETETRPRAHDARSYDTCAEGAKGAAESVFCHKAEPPSSTDLDLWGQGDAEEEVRKLETVEGEEVSYSIPCFIGQDGPAKEDAKDAAYDRVLEKARVYDDAKRALEAPLRGANEQLEELEASVQQLERFLETVDDPDQLSPEDFATANELRDKYEKSHEAAQELDAILAPLRDQLIVTGEALDAAGEEFNRVKAPFDTALEKCKA